MKAQRASRVLICSAAKMTGKIPKNIGDEALTEALALALRGHDLHVMATLSASSDSPTPGSLERVDPRQLLSLVRAMRRSQVVVLGGGTLLADNDPCGILPSGLPRYCLAVAVLARLLGRPLYIVGVGAQEWTRLSARVALRIVVRLACDVSVRDSIARDYVAQRSDVTPRLSADTIFNLPWNEDRGPGRDIALALAPNTSDADLERVVRLLPTSPPQTICIIRMDQSGEDDEIAARMAEELSARGHSVSILPKSGAWRAVLDVIGGSRVLIASRLHALLFGALNATPSVVVDATDKLTAFAREAAIPVISEVAALDDARAASRSYVESASAAASHDVRLMAFACSQR